MKRDDAVGRLRDLRGQASSLPSNVSSAEFTSWSGRARSILSKSLGDDHHITQAFIGLRWTPSVYTMGDDSAFVRTFEATVPEAQGLIDAAIFDLEELSDPPPLIDDAAYDPELWQHVSPHVLAEDWPKVASQTAIFTEDRVRRWAGRPVDDVGERLMTAVFGERADYRLGRTDGEKQGWHRFAMGLAMALRNADAHRIQDRSDHKRYALGVLGASSLLLTQIRYEHGNRFQDTSPALPARKT